MNSENEKAYFLGHRARLKQKITIEPEFLSDYELLEALLFYVFSRKDTKVLAKQLISQFSSLKNVVFSDSNEVVKIPGLGRSTAILLKIIREVFVRILREDVQKGPIISTSSNVVDYYKNLLGTLKKEQLRIMFLGSKNKLLCEKVVQEGTVNQTAIYPREIVQIALECGASGIIMVHNHPSGDSTPSRQDVLITTRIKEVLSKLEISVLDHLIITNHEVTSLRDLDLL